MAPDSPSAIWLGLDDSTVGGCSNVLDSERASLLTFIFHRSSTQLTVMVVRSGLGRNARVLDCRAAFEVPLPMSCVCAENMGAASLDLGAAVGMS